NLRDQLRAEQFAACCVTEPAIGIVDEGERRIRKKAANQFALRIDDTPVPLVALPRLLLGGAPAQRLDEQGHDERGLRQDEKQRSGRVPAVLRQKGWLPEE